MADNVAGNGTLVSTPDHDKAVIGDFTRREYRIHEQLLDLRADYRVLSRWSLAGWSMAVALALILLLPFAAF